LNEDVLETTLRATAEAVRRGELSRRQAIDLLARAIELRHSGAIEQTQGMKAEPPAEASIYIRPAPEPGNPAEQELDRLFRAAMHRWTKLR
jgi:hypothetical protein